MDHIVIPLDPTHAEVHAALVHRLAAGTGISLPDRRPAPHVTLVAHSGLSSDAARVALTAVVDETTAFIVHAHGFGFFSGSEPSDLSLFVPVTRTLTLDTLHGRVCDALRVAGGAIARWCEPDLWTPHITILDRSLDPDTLGRAAAWLARRHHPSWGIRVDRIAILGSWDARAHEGTVLPFRELW